MTSDQDSAGSSFPTQVENQMVSAERVLGYCKVSQEANLESEPGCKPEDDWPANGAIEVGQCSEKHPRVSAKPGLFNMW